jgi:hypothetical protein
MLTNPNEKDNLVRAAIMLRREAENKLTGWRATAIKDLLSESKGEIKPKRIIEAVWLRDDYNNTRYFKIALRRRHLSRLFGLLVFCITLCLLFSIFGMLPKPFDDARLVAAVILFGALGASVSVSQGLLAAEVAAKIPAQQIGSFVVWMRPAIGATLALVALVLLHANKELKILGWNTDNVGVVLAVAFVAGYSERFIVGAIERLSKTVDSSTG